jgi:predicted nucleotidyltransferase
MARRKNIGNSLLESLQKKGIEVSKIVLFGSCAQGRERKESDIDVIVVSKTFREKDIFQRVNLTRGVHREMVKIFMKPFDLMYFSDEEWENGNSLIINAAKEEGKVIYG